MKRHSCITHFFRTAFFMVSMLMLCTACMLEGDIETLRENAGLSNERSFSHARSSAQDSAIGAEGGGAVQFMVAHRWTPAQLNSAGVAGNLLTGVEFVGNVRAATYTVRVWRGGSGSPFNSGTLVAEIIIPTNTITEGRWHRVQLPNPVTIPTNQELWIGYHVNTPSGFPASLCSGPANRGFGNVIFWNSQWGTLNPQFDSNWMIRGIVESSSPSR